MAAAYLCIWKGTFIKSQVLHRVQHLHSITSQLYNSFSPSIKGPQRQGFCLILQILFILVNADEPKNKHVFEYFRITKVNIPSVQILNLSSDARYKMPTDDITYENLKKFAHSFLSKNAKVSLFLGKFYTELQNHSFCVILLALTTCMKKQNKGQFHGLIWENLPICPPWIYPIFDLSYELIIAPLLLWL